MFWETVNDQSLFVFLAPPWFYRTVLYSASIVIFRNWETLWFNQQIDTKEEKGFAVGPVVEEGGGSGGRSCSGHLLTHSVDLWSWRTDIVCWQQVSTRLRCQRKKNQGPLLWDSNLPPQGHQDTEVDGNCHIRVAGEPICHIALRGRQKRKGEGIIFSDTYNCLCWGSEGSWAAGWLRTGENFLGDFTRKS